MTPGSPQAFYNEIEPYPAQWMRNLIDAGHIAPGQVDERSIVGLSPADLAGFTQAHFFAGIGVWSHALRLAGWPDDAPVWTGSCPCQPFSAAGKRRGHADERHLWPAWFNLIRECRPPVVFGEQVASKDGLAWLDAVHADLEAEGYAIGALDLCAAGVGAPHIRQRVFFVAQSSSAERGSRRAGCCGTDRGLPRAELAGSGNAGLVGITNGAGRATWNGIAIGTQTRSGESADPGPHGLVGHADDTGSQGRRQRGNGSDELPARQTGLANRMGDPESEQVGRTGQPRQDFWRSCDWIPCRDGKARPVEPGTFPLAHGAAARVGRLRAYGNAIVAPLAAEFVRAYMEASR